jgi:hypothetical protein
MWMLASSFGGLLALAALLVVLRSITLGRALLIVGAILLLAAVLLAAIAPIFGRMPTPEDEDRSRLVGRG